MIRKLITLLILIPLAIAIVLFAVSNRGPISLAFDPFASEPPMYTFSAPLFFVLLGTMVAGVIIGGAAAWSRQSKWRRRARRLAADLKAAQAESASLRRQLETP